VSFMHEPEGNLGTCQPGAVNDPLADMGSAEDFKAAYRHVVEHGSHDDPAMGGKEQWFRDVPAVLRLAMPKVKAVVYFDRVGAPVPGDPCNWIVDSSPQAQAGFAAAGVDPHVNQPHG
jgi:hypothetical protein